MLYQDIGGVNASFCFFRGRAGGVLRLALQTMIISGNEVTDKVNTTDELRFCFVFRFPVILGDRFWSGLQILKELSC
jgi:hypothetical protein